MIELTFFKESMLVKKECDVGHYWYFLNFSFTFQPNVCNRCHDLLMMSMIMNIIAALLMMSIIMNIIAALLASLAKMRP